MDDPDQGLAGHTGPMHYARFPIIKTNRRGQRQARVLELNSTCVMNKTRSNTIKWRVSKENVYSMNGSGKNIQLTVLFRYKLRMDSEEDARALMRDAEAIKRGIDGGGRKEGKESRQGHKSCADGSGDIAGQQRDEEERGAELITEILKKPIPPTGPLPAPNDFRILGGIGQGSFGQVLLVKHRPTGKLYAMKVLNKTLIISSHQESNTLTEYYILLRIQHPFIIHLSFAFQTATNIHFVMTFAQGGDLFTHLRTRGPVREEDAIFYVAEIVSALGHLHDLNIVYRDLKPENVLLAKDGHVLLTDFGLSKREVTALFNEAEGIHTSTLCGTPEYIAPEILAGHNYGQAIDWWSLGVLMYEMLFGKSPFADNTPQKVYQKIMYGTITIPPGRSHVVSDFILSLLKRNSKERLGAKGSGEIKAHPVFSGVDFTRLEKKEIAAPFIPLFDETNYLANFTSSGSSGSTGSVLSHTTLTSQSSGSESTFSREIFSDIGWAARNE